MQTKLLILLAVILSTGFLTPVPSFPFDGDDLEVDGFVLGSVSGRTTGIGPGGKLGGDILLGEERLRINLLTWAESAEAESRVRVDFLHDTLTDEFSINLREAFVDYTRGNFDFRFGRQIATWGVGDLLFVNDIFPKDWVSFFSGRQLEYLKVGVDGLRTIYSTSSLNFDLVLVPVFQPDIVPSPDRFILFDPLHSVRDRIEEKPEVSFKNAEAAFRMYWRSWNLDLAMYAYRGFWKTPSARLFQPEEGDPFITYFYPELSVYGMSMQGSRFGGVISAEAGYYQSRQDENGTDPSVPNSQIRFLGGYQRQLIEDLTLGVQYYAEIMEDHAAYRTSLPTGIPETDRYHDIVTLRLDKLLKHQTFKLSCFMFYGPADRDYLVQPQVSYKFSDEFSFSLGANIFGGESNETFFGQFDYNDNIYTSLRFDF